ncbi:aspartyl/asparaginyl beta-hydroxylase domain-containing protein [Microcoleus sp. FACHB-1515]|uniref:aspartyl/asparaginyl beta-hydroxylase domain-containing protein n=1 Tax=Cyanophyceae TaxID=3028117 RepID=UPI0016870DEF|nr:aspartyl/asparaginyl beta-hydroxylase domain-containing protein [Microcoleus sp. FACHB-1515]MBD2092884.1 aspartyl/asparaginyl beta-hydroxylase domain-containing protein [Microcoleus sp. FACHB-1515]
MKLIRQTIDFLQAQVPHYSKVGNSTFFTVEQFPWANDLEANWHVIRAELDRVMPHAKDLPNFQDISPRQANIADDDRWKTYFFCAFGFRSQHNCDRCPETTKLLEKIPGLKVAFFSILAPGKHIPEHCGKHKGLIRYHLGLKVPEPKTACRIRINGEMAYWEEGKSLIFDDTFPHEVWNETNDYRVVLFLDIARPMRFPMSFVNWAVCQIIALSPIVQVAKGNQTAWEKQFEAIAK